MSDRGLTFPVEFKHKTEKVATHIPLRYKGTELTVAWRPSGWEYFDLKSQRPPNLEADFFLVHRESSISLMDWGQGLGMRLEASNGEDVHFNLSGWGLTGGQ